MRAQRPTAGSGIRALRTPFARRRLGRCARQLAISLAVTVGCTRPQVPSHSPRPLAAGATDSVAVAFYDRAQALAAAGSREASDSAVLLYHAAIEQDSTFAEAFVGLALMHLTRVTRFGVAPTWRDTALALARRVLPLAPAQALYTIGLGYGDRGEQRWALEALHAAFEHDSASPIVASALGSRYFQVGDAERSAYWHARATQLDSTRLSVQLGYCYLFLNDLDSAETWFRKYLASRRTLSDADFQAFGGLNLVRFVRGRFRVAIQTAESLAASSPENAFLHSLAGEAHFFAGHNEAARIHFERALALSPTVIAQFTARSAALPLAHLYTAAGERTRVSPLLDRTIAWAERRLGQGREPSGAFYALAAVHLVEGDTAGVYHWLQAAADAGMPQARLARLDPVFAQLRDQPRYRDFVARLDWRLREARLRRNERETRRRDAR